MTYQKQIQRKLQTCVDHKEQEEQKRGQMEREQQESQQIINTSKRQLKQFTEHVTQMRNSLHELQEIVSFFFYFGRINQ